MLRQILLSHFSRNDRGLRTAVDQDESLYQEASVCEKSGLQSTLINRQGWSTIEKQACVPRVSDSFCETFEQDGLRRSSLRAIHAHGACINAVDASFLCDKAHVRIMGHYAYK